MFTFGQLVNAAAGGGSPAMVPARGAPSGDGTNDGSGVPNPTGYSYVDNNNLGGLSTYGGLYAGGKFWRGPGELLQALRRGEMSLGSLGKVYFGLNSDPNATYSNPGVGHGSFDVSGFNLPQGGFSKGQGVFGSQGEYDNFMKAFGGGQQGGMRYKLLQALGLL